MKEESRYQEGSGYWKATSAVKPINAKGGKKRVGIKKALVSMNIEGIFFFLK